MKLLFYINILSDGGAERVIANLSNYFADTGHTVILVNTFKTLNEYEVSNKVKRYFLEEKSDFSENFLIRNFKRILSLRQIIKKEKPELVISFMKEPNVRNLLATLGLKKVKKVISVRQSPNIEYKGIVGGFIAKFILPLTDGCVFQTEIAKDWFPKSLQAKSQIIMNPIRNIFYMVERKPVYGKIVTMGRLIKQKNQSLLIKSFNMIKDEFPQASLDIYGVGEEFENLKSLIERLDLYGRVCLKGRTSKPEKILSLADIFVLSSDYEGLPNALLEAMAVGIPCIATDCLGGGAKMVISNQINGLLIPRNDIEKMADAMRLLLRNNCLKEKLSLNSREYTYQIKPEVICAKWEEFFKEILK